MTATTARRSNQLATALTVSLVGMLGIAFSTMPHRNAIAQAGAPSVSEPQAVTRSAKPTAHEDGIAAGISLAGSVTDQDAAYLRDNLQQLHDRLPVWWQYVMDARPLALSVDLVQGEHGRAAITRCCEMSGIGVITFGLHFGQQSLYDDADGETVQSRQITFLGILIHESTHVHDLRVGRFKAKTDRKTCVAAESSGLQKQLEFKQDLASADFTTNPASNNRFQRVVKQQIQIETHDLHDRVFWDYYCSAFAG